MQKEEAAQTSLTEAEKAEKKRAKKARQRSARAQAAAQQAPCPAQESGTENAEQSAGKQKGGGDVKAASAAVEPIEKPSGKQVKPAEQTASRLMRTEAPGSEPAKLSSQASAEAERPKGPIEGKRKGRSRKQTCPGAAPQPSPLSAPADKAEASALPGSDSVQAGLEVAQQADPCVHGNKSITLMAASPEAFSGEAPQESGHTDRALPRYGPLAAHAGQERCIGRTAGRALAGGPGWQAQAGCAAGRHVSRSAQGTQAARSGWPSRLPTARRRCPLSRPSSSMGLLQSQAPPQSGSSSSLDWRLCKPGSTAAQPQAVAAPPVHQPSPLRCPPVQQNEQPAARIGSSIQESVSISTHLQTMHV